MKITARTALELASHEGLVRQAYKDSVSVWNWRDVWFNAGRY